MRKIIRSMPLYVFMLLLLLAAFGVSYFSYYNIVLKSMDDKILEDAQEDNYQIALSATSYFDAKIKEQISTIIGIEVAHHNIIDDDSIFDEGYYETILDQNEHLSSIEVLNMNDVILYSSKEDNNRVGINLSDYAIVENAILLHTLYTGGMVFDTASERLTLEIIYTGEDVKILATISTTYFDLYAAEFHDSFNDKEILIFNDKGIILFDSKNNMHLIQARFADFDELFTEQDVSNSFEYNVDEEPSIVSLVGFETSEWSLLLYESMDSALALSGTTTDFSLLLLYVILSIFLVVYLVINFIVVREIKVLGFNLSKVGSGNFELIQNKTTFKEILAVRSQFNKMSIDLSDMTQRLTYTAYHDNITGLPSKNKGLEDFNAWKESADNITFLYMDIERFSMINDNYGFDIGDYCLSEVSKILSSYLNHVYRVESDEFLCLFKDVSYAEIVNLVEELSSRLNQGIKINNYQYSVPVNIGLASYPSNGDSYLDILKKSMIAMNVNKTSKTALYTKFEDEYLSYYLRNSKIELLARSAINDDEFFTVYQPIVNIKDESIRGFEALTRWNSPELGSVSPVDFIPIMERTGLINQIDERVLNNALRMNKYLCDFYKTKFVMSVNVSVVTIMSANFVDVIDEALDRFDYDPNLLEIEITESTIISDFDSVTRKMKYLKQKGIKFSEDDFGDGFSSLTYLSRLKLDTLKISKNFLSSILTNVESRLLVQTILELSKRLGFFTIVEGVEDEKTLEVFKMYGCDFVQGYLFYRPMNEEALLNLVKTRME